MKSDVGWGEFFALHELCNRPVRFATWLCLTPPQELALLTNQVPQRWGIRLQGKLLQ